MIETFKNNPFALSWKEKLEKLHPHMVKVICECGLDQYTLNFWSEKISIRDNPEVARIDGNHYIISTQGLKGMSGAKFKIEFFDGRIVETDNLWHQGRIPESYRRVLSDNAKFL